MKPLRRGTQGNRVSKKATKVRSGGPSVAGAVQEISGRLGFGIGLLLLGLAIYWPSLSGLFLLDDFDLMDPYDTVRRGGSGGLLGTGRPLLMLSYVLNHRLGGFDPFGFHLTNVLLHGLNAVLLRQLVLTLLSQAPLVERIAAKWRKLLIYALPLLFLTTPIQTESVAYISSRSEVLAATFYST